MTSILFSSLYFPISKRIKIDVFKCCETNKNFCCPGRGMKFRFLTPGSPSQPAHPPSAPQSRALYCLRAFAFHSPGILCLPPPTAPELCLTHPSAPRQVLAQSCPQRPSCPAWLAPRPPGQCSWTLLTAFPLVSQPPSQQPRRRGQGPDSPAASRAQLCAWRRVDSVNVC